MTKPGFHTKTVWLMASALFQKKQDCLCFLCVDDYLWKLHSSGFGATISSFICSHLFLRLASSSGWWLDGRSDGHVGRQELRSLVNGTSLELINSSSGELS